MESVLKGGMASSGPGSCCPGQVGGRKAEQAQLHPARSDPSISPAEQPAGEGRECGETVSQAAEEGQGSAAIRCWAHGLGASQGLWEASPGQLCEVFPTQLFSDILHPEDPSKAGRGVPGRYYAPAQTTPGCTKAGLQKC